LVAEGFIFFLFFFFPLGLRAEPPINPISPPAVMVGPPWYEADFDTNLHSCRPFQRPLWCKEWLELMEEIWVQPTDPKIPEWERLPFVRNLPICVSLFPPSWCVPWLERMRELTRQRVYLERAETARAAIAAVAAAQEAALKEWREVVERIQSKNFTVKDVINVDRRARAGEPDAMELLAWMYLNGRGVPQSYYYAYEFYGKALLVGRPQLKENLDKIWPFLKAAEKEAARRQFELREPSPPK
jgi:hypothetical protein